MEREIKSYPLMECKADEAGRFKGYASTYQRDAYGDRIVPGAFAQSIKDQRGRIPIFLDHSRDNWVGFSTDLAEDAKGLFIDAQLSLKSTRGADAYALLQTAQSCDYNVGLSIGFIPTEVDTEESAAGLARVIKTIDLYEVSLTPFPANKGARVQDFKSIRNVEQILRDVGGCSRDAARKATACLRPYLSVDADGNPTELSRDVQALGHKAASADELLRRAIEGIAK